MKNVFAAASIAAVIVASAADAREAKRLMLVTSQIAPARLIPQPAMMEAMAEVDSCASKARPGSPIELCNRTWKGIKWTLYSNWNAQLDTPSGERWFLTCKYDSINREDRCNFSTGDQFHIGRGDGYAVAVIVGLERFPGSEATIRFDDAAPISTTTEAWGQSQSTAIYRRMMNAKIMRYRFSDWPMRGTHDGHVDLTSFADTAALMEAIRDQFTIARVLKRVDVPD